MKFLQKCATNKITKISSVSTDHVVICSEKRSLHLFRPASFVGFEGSFVDFSKALVFGQHLKLIDLFFV